MSKTVCVDALVYWNGTALGERNETSVRQEADVAEAKTFVSSLAEAYSTKQSTWKNWTVALNGYYDDADDTMQNAIRDGTVAQIVIYPTRDNLTNYWYGDAFPTSCEQTINTDDFSELNTEFQGSGKLTWINA